MSRLRIRILVSLAGLAPLVFGGGCVKPRYVLSTPHAPAPVELDSQTPIREFLVRACPNDGIRPDDRVDLGVRVWPATADFVQGEAHVVAEVGADAVEFSIGEGPEGNWTMSASDADAICDTGHYFSFELDDLAAGKAVVLEWELEISGTSYDSDEGTTGFVVTVVEAL